MSGARGGCPGDVIGLTNPQRGAGVRAEGTLN